MERLDSKLHQKYTALKKRKLLDEGLERKREAELKELYDAMKDRISELEKDNDELNEKLADKEDELDKARQEFLEDIRTRDGEILRLKQLLDKKSEKNNSTATGSPGLTPRAILENPTPMAPKSKTPLSHGKVKRVQLIEIAPHSSPTEESQELECSRRNSCISGNGTNEILSARMFHLLLQSLVRMKISVNDGTEMFSVSVCHEASGYSFTLTWLEKHGEWSYKPSSLGTLDRIAIDWMRQDIRFSMNMSHMFFQRISRVVTKG
ncbi:hypothetical protein BDA96_07G195700 [Sorghum bicolor]|uniref:DUF7806 domain-containing protein n=1 Tax=Sorghum bicolor TaxID=4558 RepID=A0A921U9Y6_SORBI|nr:uncharacterized protein LOC8060903 [Sorghum bicolor]XP_021320149.1 uncharacterized protein LOC8060903 [Sorghum bicolor]KAG0524262.1 hypothetical protein BDA96_07G195700 [Sorghum bicolor]|eukprot:XP_002445766.1 uncharacterized protein LOC8060903 [Sorghum bicolor]